MSFRDLKNREIINEADGRRLGKTKDIVFSPQRGQILGIVAPFHHRTFPIFRGEQIYIPFKHIIKIGPDVILVKLTPDLCRPDGCIDLRKGHRGEQHHQHHHERKSEQDNKNDRRDDRVKELDGEKRECDKRCEKCMMFDCERRWEAIK